MSHPNTERDERVRQIRERAQGIDTDNWYRRQAFPVVEARKDIDYLLSLLDSQVSKVRVLRGQWHDSYIAADTSSKEALVRKELLFAKCQAASEIITALQSLTLDQVEQEKQK